MYLSRNEAVVFASFMKLINLSLDERKNALDEIGIEDDANVSENIALRECFVQEFNKYNNSYISSYLSKYLHGSIEIKDDDIQLFPCSCCGYNTIEREKEYFICKVCYWEDDGVRDENTYSSANGMTLKEAKLNFAKLGVMSEKFLEVVDKERMHKYNRSL